MDIKQFFNDLSLKFLLDTGLKLLGIITAIIYLCFATVVIKQVEVMRKSIEIEDRGLFLLAAFVQLILSVILLFYSLVIL
jgi:hypothetical protein